MTPMAYAWTLFSGASIIKRRLTWTNDDPFAGSEVYGDVYQVVGVPLFSDEWEARAKAAEYDLATETQMRKDQDRRLEKAEARVEAMRLALEEIEDLAFVKLIDAYSIARAALEAKP